MIITASTLSRRDHLDLLDRLMAADLMDVEFGEELSSPRRVQESAQEYAAREAARFDIAAELLDEYIAGGGDEWFESDPYHWPVYDAGEAA